MVSHGRFACISEVRTPILLNIENLDNQLEPPSALGISTSPTVSLGRHFQDMPRLPPLKLVHNQFGGTILCAVKLQRSANNRVCPRGYQFLIFFLHIRLKSLGTLSSGVWPFLLGGLLQQSINMSAGGLVLGSDAIVFHDNRCWLIDW
ncbi:hypothetical protein GX48_07629 [Paracoccidioides brasiliensis]|nr:hypothetical protein GX48_07629 [Paracoccidioides brasiliensis]